MNRALPEEQKLYYLRNLKFLRSWLYPTSFRSCQTLILYFVVVTISVGGVMHALITDSWLLVPAAVVTGLLPVSYLYRLNRESSRRLSAPGPRTETERTG